MECTLSAMTMEVSCKESPPQSAQVVTATVTTEVIPHLAQGAAPAARAIPEAAATAARQAAMAVVVIMDRRQLVTVAAAAVTDLCTLPAAVVPDPILTQLHERESSLAFLTLGNQAKSSSNDESRLNAHTRHTRPQRGFPCIKLSVTLPWFLCIAMRGCSALLPDGRF